MRALPQITFLFVFSCAFGQWALLSSGSAANLNAVRFVDNDTGWIVGSNSTILKTVNGGSSWATQTNTIHFPSTFSGVAFVNGQRGVVTDAVGWDIRSTDGGATWTSLEQLNVRHAVHFTTKDLGWVVGVRESISKSTDGGVTWGQSITPHGGEGARTLYGIHFTGADTGWATGAYSGSGEILKTTNSGLSWNELFPINQPKALRDVYAINGKKAWFVGADGEVQTTDINPVVEALLFIKQSSGTAHNLNAVRFVNENSGWIVGDSGIILKTSNGGTTWTPQASGTTANLRGLHFTPNGTGWAVGDGGVLLKYAPENTSVIPAQFHIGSNGFRHFPNPFSSYTHIQFRVSSANTKVNLKVYNAQGTVIETLVDGILTGGTHTFEFNGSQLSKGVYLAVLRVGNMTEIQRMLRTD